MKRLRNSSGIPDEVIADVVRWIADDLGITQFDVECRNCSGTFAGRAYTTGSRRFHGNRKPFVVLRVGTEKIERWTANGGKRIAMRRSWLGSAHQDVVKVTTKRFPTFIQPYQYAHHRDKRYVLANRIEALVYLTAHELRHLWQAAQWDDKRKSKSLPLAFGARGKYSEVDTESYAIRMLRQWRMKCT